MTLYVNHHTEILLLGAAGPYSAALLAAVRTPLPFGARRVLAAQDTWDGTAGNTIGSVSPLVAYLKATSIAADIQVYSAASTHPIPEDMTHYVVWSKSVAGATPIFEVLSWEIWSQ
jgi:hypothetical protein